MDEAKRFHRAVVTGAIEPSSTELIVVDDGSSDDTARLSEHLFADSFSRVRVIRRAVNSGKGAAIRDGVAVARSPIVMFMDADMAVDPQQTPRLVGALDEADIAIASRSVPGSIVESDNQRRALMGRTFSRYVNVLTRMNIVDTQCGFKAFRTPVARLLFHCLRIERFAFDVDLLYQARTLGLRVTEVPIHWRDVAGSAVRPMADPVSMVWDVLRLCLGRKAPLIPALVVSAESAGSTRRFDTGIDVVVSHLFGQHNLVLSVSPDRLVVLFPLTDPEAVRRGAARIEELAPECAVRDELISIDQLTEFAFPPLLVQPAPGGPRASTPSENGSAPVDRLGTGCSGEETLSIPGS